MSSEVSNCCVKMSNLINKMMIGLFQLNTSGFTVLQSNTYIVELNSKSIKLVVKISNSSIKMRNLVSKSVIGLLKLVASGFAVG